MLPRRLLDSFRAWKQSADIGFKERECWCLDTSTTNLANAFWDIGPPADLRVIRFLVVLIMTSTSGWLQIRGKRTLFPLETRPLLISINSNPKDHQAAMAHGKSRPLIHLSTSEVSGLLAPVTHKAEHCGGQGRRVVRSRYMPTLHASLLLAFTDFASPLMNTPPIKLTGTS